MAKMSLPDDIPGFFGLSGELWLYLLLCCPPRMVTSRINILIKVNSKRMLYRGIPHVSLVSKIEVFL